MGFLRLILHLLQFERPETATRPEHSDMDPSALVLAPLTLGGAFHLTDPHAFF
jgi:hypothetical protein